MIESAVKKSQMAAFYFLAGLSKFEQVYHDKNPDSLGNNFQN